MSFKVTKKDDLEKERDSITLLQKQCPAIFEYVFGELISYETLLEMQKVPRWQSTLSNAWKRRYSSKMAKCPIWRTLSSRATSYEPSLVIKLNGGHPDNYRKLCQRIEETSQSIKNNLEVGYFQPTKEAIISFFKDEYAPNTCYVTEMAVNHQHIFIVYRIKKGWRVKVYNRWNLTLEKHFDSRFRIFNLQINSRFAVFQIMKYGANIIHVLDTNALKILQTIPEDPWNRNIGPNRGFDCFFLSEELLYVAHMSLDDWPSAIYETIVDIRSFNHSTGCFETIKKNQFKYNGTRPFTFPKMYVDDKYLILDCLEKVNTKWVRNIQVQCIKTLRLICNRKFRYVVDTKREYINGKIIAFHAIDQSLVEVLWDVNENVVQKTANTDENLSDVTHFSDYQVSLIANHRCSVKFVRKAQDSEESGQATVARPYETRLNHDLAKDCILYCDGVQIITTLNHKLDVCVINLI